jgi:hypothetical protein
VNKAFSDKIEGIDNVLRLALLQPFEDLIAHADSNNALPSRPNSEACKVALLAHLIVHSDAKPYWENLYADIPTHDKPAAYDATTNPSNQAKEQLVSIANAIKNDLDKSSFDSAFIGEDSNEACLSLKPETAILSVNTPTSLRTTWVNKHDELISNLDASGGKLPPGVERNLKCFEHLLVSLVAQVRLLLFLLIRRSQKKTKNLRVL